MNVDMSRFVGGQVRCTERTLGTQIVGGIKNILFEDAPRKVELLIVVAWKLRRTRDGWLKLPAGRMGANGGKVAVEDLPDGRLLITFETINEEFELRRPGDPFPDLPDNSGA